MLCILPEPACKNKTKPHHHNSSGDLTNMAKRVEWGSVGRESSPRSRFPPSQLLLADMERDQHHPFHHYHPHHHQCHRTTSNTTSPPPNHHHRSNHGRPASGWWRLPGTHFCHVTQLVHFSTRLSFFSLCNRKQQSQLEKSLTCRP